MSRLMSNIVSIHPYFKVHSGQMDAARAILVKFIDLTKTEAACLYYDFTVNGDIVFCREAYVGAAGALAHLANVNDALGEMLKVADLIRLELHGSAVELAQLKEPLAALPVEWFEFEIGLVR